MMVVVESENASSKKNANFVWNNPINFKVCDRMRPTASEQNEKAATSFTTSSWVVDDMLESWKIYFLSSFPLF